MIRVLSFGYAEELLQKRHDLLVFSGLTVTLIDRKAAVLRLIDREVFDALVIGHGVPLKDRNEVAWRTKCRTKARIIFLYRWTINNAELADAVLSVESSVEDLPEAIKRLVDSDLNIAKRG
jgi:hypothetical protein